MLTERFALAGSHRTALYGSRAVGAPDPTEHIDAMLVLRRRLPIGPHIAGAPPMDRHVFALAHGASPDDVRSVDDFARQFNLSVGGVDLRRRMVTLSGTVAALSEAFGTTLKMYQTEHGTFRGRSGELFLPASLRDVVVAVLGLDNRPQAHPRFRRRPHGPSAEPMPRAFTPTEVAKLYGTPPGTGHGETIAIIELGGGYRPTDLRAYFDKHAKEFTNPGRAVLSVVTIPRLITAADTAAARNRALKLRDEITKGAKFEDVAKRESSDSVSNDGDTWTSNTSYN